ncbi:MAG: phosphate transporter substrate-binding protein, PhoT family [Gemmatimonadetes bacterium]|nr:phosphate transporter substrate-binding protein, PhoT family [Gemmatimonadota bacterium]
MRATQWLPRMVLGLIALGMTGPLSAQSLTGAGATFPYPIYSKWFDAYARKTGTKINYQSIGSGGGIRQFTQGTVDFGASDGPMTDEQIAAVKGNVVHLPTVLGAVVLTYNLPALGMTPLKLDAATVAAIFLGKITSWNDPRIAALNPGVKLPKMDLIVVHRSDGSGTTFVFVDYLSKVSPEWKSKVGTATSVSWPTGLGGKGNEGVTQQIKQLEGSLGYVELVYAASNKLPVALVKNAAGQYVEPTLEAVTAAASGAKLAKDTDFRVSITNAGGAKSYPIASYTWLLVKTDNPDAGKAKTIRDFLNWMTTAEAQRMADDLGYAPLPSDVVTLVQARVKTLKTAGRPIG